MRRYKSKKKQKRWYEWNGRIYRTIQEMAIGENLSYAGARERILRGEKSDEDIRKPKPCTVWGVTYASYKEAMIKLGKTKKQILGRVWYERKSKQ